MDQGHTILSIKCPERSGTIVRDVRLCRINREKIKFLWSQLSRFETLFGNVLERDLEVFAQRFLRIDENGEVHPTCIVYEVDTVGILVIDDIRPEYEATFHYTFWDRRFNGRRDLIRAFLLYIFQTMKFHRIVTEVPVYSRGANQCAIHLGFRREGRKRETFWYHGEWFDSIFYSILEREVSNGSETVQDNGDAGVSGQPVREGLPELPPGAA